MKNVGIIIRENEFNDIKYIACKKDLFDFVNSFDVFIIGIPIDIGIEKILNVVKLCDGIILSGGKKPLENDFLLTDYLYKNNIPTLGICLGMQTMAEHFNNHYEEKIDNHNSKDEYVHNVIINKDSKLYKIIGKRKIKVNSRHNDYIPFTNLFISAYSDDGIIEAVEDSSKKFFIGVQWHPESLSDINSYLLIKAFVDSLN